VWVIRWQPYRPPDQAIRLQTARGFERDETAVSAEHGRSFTARRFYRRYTIPLAAVGLFYLNAVDTSLSVPPALNEPSRAFTAKQVYKSWKQPRQLSNYYYRGSERAIDRVEPPESGRSFTARRLYRPQRASSQIRLAAHLYYRGSERSIDRVELVVENARSFTARNLFKSFKAPIVQVSQLYYRGSERSETRLEPAETNNTQVIVWKSYRAPKHHVRLYYFQTIETAFSIVPPPVEFGRHFVARRLYSKTQASKAKISQLYYHERGQVESVAPPPVAEASQPSIVRRLVKAYRAPLSAGYWYYRAPMPFIPAQAKQTFLATLRFTQTLPQDLRFAQTQGETLKFQPKFTKKVRFNT